MLETMTTAPLSLALFTGSWRPDGVSAAAAQSVKAALPSQVRAVDVVFGGFPLYDPRLHLGPLGSPDGADLPEPSVSPSPAGGVRAQGALKTVLGGMVAQVFPFPEVALAGTFAARGDDGGLAEPAARERVAALMHAFVATLER